MALQRGDVGPAVLAAQVLLRVPRTGVFDAITELAVVHLQQKFGLLVNGILDTAEYNAARHGSSHETAGADPIDPAAITGAPWVLKAGDTMTGNLTIGSGKNLKLTGGAGAGQGCIVFGAAASTFWDSNVCTVDSSAKTMGYVCGTTAAFTGSSGPFFGLRGNTFAAQPTQRGNIFLFGGKPSTPGANEGRVIFGTNDTERMYITYAGLVVMANATISDLPAGRVVVTTTGGRCASDAGLTWASSTLGTTKLQVGSGTAITKIVVYTPSLTPASVAAGAPSEQTFAVAGLTTADTVTVNAPGAAVFSARVSAADTLALTFMPPAAGSYTPPAGTYRILAHRS